MTDSYKNKSCNESSVARTTGGLRCRYVYERSSHIESQFLKWQVTETWVAPILRHRSRTSCNAPSPLRTQDSTTQESATERLGSSRPTLTAYTKSFQHCLMFSVRLTTTSRRLYTSLRHSYPGLQQLTGKWGLVISRFSQERNFCQAAKLFFSSIKVCLY